MKQKLKNLPHHIRKKIISKEKKYVKGIKDVVREHEDKGSASEDSEGRVKRPKKAQEEAEGEEAKAEAKEPVESSKEPPVESAN